MRGVSMSPYRVQGDETEQQSRAGDLHLGLRVLKELLLSVEGWGRVVRRLLRCE